jgi:hypothetical protein
VTVLAGPGDVLLVAKVPARAAARVARQGALRVLRTPRAVRAAGHVTVTGPGRVGLRALVPGLPVARAGRLARVGPCRARAGPVVLARVDLALVAGWVAPVPAAPVVPVA